MKIFVLFSFFFSALSLQAKEKFHYFQKDPETNRIVLCYEFKSTQKPEFSEKQQEEKIFGPFEKAIGPCERKDALACLNAFEGPSEGFRYAWSETEIFFLFKEKIRANTFLYVDRFSDRFPAEEKKEIKDSFEKDYCKRTEGSFVDYCLK